MSNSPFYSEEELEAEMDEFLEHEKQEAIDETFEEVAEELWIDEEELRKNEAIKEIIESYVNDYIDLETMFNKIEKTLREKAE